MGANLAGSNGRWARGGRASGILAGLACIALAGCSSGSGLQQSLNGEPAKDAVSQSRRTVLVSLPQIVGGADAQFSQVMVRQLNQTAIARNIALVVDPDVPCDYTLRGYMFTQHEASGVKLSYFWDVIDKSGTRVNRIEGEELAGKVPANGDVWAAIPPAISVAIADKTITSLLATIRPAVVARAGG